MRREDVISTFRQLIIDDLAPVGEDELGPDVELLDGVIDSFGLTVVFAKITELIGRPLEPEERRRSTVSTLNAIADFVLDEARS